MTPQQREAAMRLADELQRFDGAERESLRDEAAALLRELAAAQGEHQQHWCTYCRGVNAHNCQFNPNVPRMQTYVTTSTSTSTAPLFDHPPQQRQPLTEDLLRRARNLLSHPASWRAELSNIEACSRLMVKIDKHLHDIRETP